MLNEPKSTLKVLEEAGITLGETRICQGWYAKPIKAIRLPDGQVLIKIEFSDILPDSDILSKDTWHTMEVVQSWTIK